MPTTKQMHIGSALSRWVAAQGLWQSVYTPAVRRSDARARTSAIPASRTRMKMISSASPPSSSRY